MEHEIEFSSKDISRTFIIEPWAEEFSVSPGAILKLVVYSSDCSMRISLHNQYVICFLCGGATARVYVDGKDISRDLLIDPAPLV
jgi:hypothetical protein